MPVDHNVEAAMRRLDILHVYQPRIEPKATQGMLDAAFQGSPFDEVFRADKDRAIFGYQLGLHLASHAAAYWFRTLTTRQMLELILWDSTHPKLLRNGNPWRVPFQGLAVDALTSHVRDIRHVTVTSIETMAETYRGASGTFLSSDAVPHFQQLQGLIVETAPAVFLPTLCLMLMSVNLTDGVVASIAASRPWFRKVPENIWTWGG